MVSEVVGERLQDFLRCHGTVWLLQPGVSLSPLQGEKAGTLSC
jgi:hypothetical protein